jgi:hypothetical protein
MAMKSLPATQRRPLPSRPGHRDHKTLLTLGALCAILGGWLALARWAPATANTPGQIGGDAAVPTTISLPALNPARGTAPSAGQIPTQPGLRPITRTRSSR